MSSYDSRISEGLAKRNSFYCLTSAKVLKSVVKLCSTVAHPRHSALNIPDKSKESSNIYIFHVICEKKNHLINIIKIL